LNILVVGLGSIGKKHVEAIFKICHTANVYALRSNINSDVIENVTNLYSLSEINFVLDFVIISNVSAFHEKSILEMCSFNCPLFIEKPVLNSLQNSDQIKKELEINKTRTYVACNLRFHPAIIFLKEFLKKDNSIINEVNIYCGSYLPEWRRGVDYKKNYSANKDLGGGVQLDLIHELDYCTWLFGFPIKSESIKRSVSSLQIDSYDFAQFSLFYPNFLANITLNYFRRDSKREIEVVTSINTIVVDLINNTVMEKINKRFLFQEQFDIYKTYELQMKYFIEALNSDVEFINDFNYSVKVLKIAICE
jgi:predicted dehydrogenase